MGKINVGVQVGGQYTLRVEDAEGNTKWKSGPFDNRIVDAGLNIWVGETKTDNQLMSSCGVGTGTSATQDSMTTLENAQGSTVGDSFDDSSNSGGSPWWYETYREFTFNTAGDNNIDGVSLSEVGIFINDGTLWSRSLIRDGNGDPTTITLLENEILVVGYTLRLYLPEDDVTGTFTADGDTWDYTLRIARADFGSVWGSFHLWPETQAEAWDGDIGSITSGPSGTSNDSSSISTESYVDESLERTISCFFGINRANFETGIGAVSFKNSTLSGRQAWQCRFRRQSDGSKLVKTEDETLSFNSFLTVSVSRYTP